MKNNDEPKIDSPDRMKETRLLIIRLSAMGDVAMTVPVLSALTRQYPKLRITILTKPFFAQIFHQFENVEVYEADVNGRHRGIIGLLRLYKELRARKIDAVTDLHNVLRSNILKFYFRIGGIPFNQIDKGRADKKRLTSLRNKVFMPLKTTHQRYADVFEALGFPIDLSMAIPLSKEQLSPKTLELLGASMTEDYAGKERNGGEMGKRVVADTKKWLGIAPFAAFEGKTYPLHLMEEVLRELDNSGQFTIYLFGGGKNEEQLLDAIQARFTGCINIAGKLLFREELALISNLDAMMSMDSGNGHLAAMYGIPVITLWGVTHPFAGFYPFGEDVDNALMADREKFPLIPTSVYGNKVPPGYEKAMETILPGEVVRKIKSILNVS